MKDLNKKIALDGAYIRLNDALAVASADGASAELAQVVSRRVNEFHKAMQDALISVFPKDEFTITAECIYADDACGQNDDVPVLTEPSFDHGALFVTLREANALKRLAAHEMCRQAKKGK